MNTFEKRWRNMSRWVLLIKIVLTASIVFQFNLDSGTPLVYGENIFPYNTATNLHAAYDPSGKLDIVWSAYNSSSLEEDIFYVKVWEGEYLIDPVVIFKGGKAPVCLPYNNISTFIAFWRTSKEGYFLTLIEVEYTKEGIIIEDGPIDLISTPVKMPGPIRIRKIGEELSIFYSWGGENAAGISCWSGGVINQLINTTERSVSFDVAYDGQGRLFVAWWDIIDNVSGIYLREFNYTLNPSAPVKRKSIVNIRSWVGMRISGKRIHLLFTAARSGESDLIYTTTDLNGSDLIDDVRIFSAPETLHFYLFPSEEDAVGPLVFTAVFRRGLRTIMDTFVLPTNITEGALPGRVRENITDFGEVSQEGYNDLPVCMPLLSRGKSMLVYPSPQARSPPQMICWSFFELGKVTASITPNISERKAVGDWMNITINIHMKGPLPKKVSVEISTTGIGFNQTEVIWIEYDKEDAALPWNQHLLTPGDVTLAVIVDPMRLLLPEMKEGGKWRASFLVVQERVEFRLKSNNLTLNPEESYNISLSVVNVGVGNISFFISPRLDGEVCSWALVFPKRGISLGEGEEATLWLLLSPTYHLPSKDYRISLEAISTFSDEIIGIGKLQVHITEKVRGYVYVPQTITVYPSRDNRVRLTLKNSGNVKTAFQLRAEMEDIEGDAVFDMSATFLTGEMNPGETLAINLHIHLSKHLPPGTLGRLLIYCTPLAGGDSSQSTINVTVGEEVSGELSLSWNEYIFHPDLEKNITGVFRIKNTGNTYLNTRVYFNNLPSGWVVRLSPEEFDISPNNETIGRFLIEFSTVPQAGEYSFSISLDMSQEGGGLIQYPLRIVVVRYTNVTATVIMGKETVAVTQTPFSYRWVLKVENQGNTPAKVYIFTGGELYRFAVVYIAGLAYNWTSTPLIELGPGEALEVSVEVQIQKALRGDHTLKIVFFQDDENITSAVTMNVTFPTSEKDHVIIILLGGLFGFSVLGVTVYYLYKRRGVSIMRKEEEEDVI